jgi:hypothetical protein
VAHGKGGDWKRGLEEGIKSHCETTDCPISFQETVKWRTVKRARRQALAHGNHTFAETAMWPTVKSAGRQALAHGIHAFRETVMWPPVDRTGR